jgi:hypothetical protein
MEADRSEKARCRTSGMHVAGESDNPIVPGKPANNGRVPLHAEPVEGRGRNGKETEKDRHNR